jgi:hypothetical protein
VQRIVSRQACVSGVGNRTVVDPEAHLPYDMRTETVIAPSLLVGEGGTLNCAPSAVAVAGNGAPLSWRPSAVADAGNGPGGPAPTQSRQGWDGGDRLHTVHVRLRRGVV